jgi:cupin 2 domain-containing protein
MRKERRISKREFERVFAVWSDYKVGTVRRGKLAILSQNTTYILSILHWREEFQSSAAPTPMNPPASMPSRPDRASVTGGGRRHDEYGKRVLREATKGAAIEYGTPVEINYGAGQPARIDAIVGDIAVEIESRVSKRVRGAVVDLICHPHPKKLLLLLPVHMNNTGVTAEQCRNIMKRFCPDGSFRVIILKGSGRDPQLAEDTVMVAAALADLGSAGDPPVLKGNICSAIPDRFPEEIMETLVNSRRVRIQRIISDSHASPEGFLYDQDENEWVLLLKGSAALRFERGEEVLILEPGDWVDIPAHVRHRVEWTGQKQKTVWLAVFY